MTNIFSTVAATAMSTEQSTPTPVGLHLEASTTAPNASEQYIIGTDDAIYCHHHHSTTLIMDAPWPSHLILCGVTTLEPTTPSHQEAVIIVIIIPPNATAGKEAEGTSHNCQTQLHPNQSSRATAVNSIDTSLTVLTTDKQIDMSLQSGTSVTAL